MTEEANSWIQTFTGRRFDPLNPKSNDIDILDIAHALANQNRFAGHTKPHGYSIAQHSVLVATVLAGPVRYHSFIACPERRLGLRGLLHDATEAYISDIPRPVKHSQQFDFYRNVEDGIEKAIEEKFELPHWGTEYIKRADQLVLVAESEDLMSPLDPTWKFQTANGYTRWFPEIRVWSAGESELRFLQYYTALKSDRWDKAIAALSWFLA